MKPTLELFRRFADSSHQNELSASEYPFLEADVAFGLIEAMYVAAAIEHPEWGAAIAKLIKDQMWDMDAYTGAIEGIVSDLAVELVVPR